MADKNSIYNFLSKLNLVSLENWKNHFESNCDFTITRNKQNNSINIKISFNKVLPANILIPFIDSLNLVDDTVLFNLAFNYDTYNQDDILNYLTYFVNNNIEQKKKESNEKKELLYILKYNSGIKKAIISDNAIFLHYLEKDQEKSIKKYLEHFRKFLNDHGFTKHHLSYILDEKTIDIISDHKNQIQEKIKSELTEVKKSSNAKKTDSSFTYKFRKSVTGDVIKLSDLFFEMKTATIEGEIFKVDKVVTKTGYEIYKYFVTDYSDSIVIKALFGKKINKDVLSELKEGVWIKARISIQIDMYENNDITGLIEEISIINKPKEFIRHDNALIKRTELVNHTNMTAFEGLVNIKELFKFSSEMGYSSVAITDKFNCQNFPDFYNEAKKYSKLKAIYGVQFNIIDKLIPIVLNANDTKISDATYVIFDIETTGLSPYYDKIIEFGAIKYHKGVQLESMQMFINPEEKISDKIFSITKISNEDVKDALKIKEALVKIKEFIGDSVLIAHNGIKFDLPFLNCKLEENKMDIIKNPLIDTLQISRAINEQIHGHSLGVIARKYKIDYDETQAHRADKDAEYLLNIWKRMLENQKLQDVKTLNQINSNLQNDFLRERNRGSLITVYCKNESEIRNLYKLISISLTSNFDGGPKVYWENFNEFNGSFIVSNSATEGEIFDAAMSNTEQVLEDIIKNKYDFITIGSPECFLHDIHREIYKREWIEDAIKRIIKIANKYNKKVVATSDTYYLNESDEVYFRVYVNAKVLGGKRNRLFKYNELNTVLPKYYFRTTDELKNEFSFLNDPVLVNDIVVTNSNHIASLIDANIKPIKETLHSPHIEGASDKLKQLIYQKSYSIFGDTMNNDVKARIDREISSVIDNGYAMIYWFSHLLVKQSVDDGYVVGSRGSVGSSVAAWLVDITEVNPLEPHYICTNCKYFNFEKNVDSGFDLPESNCPKCKNKLKGDGHNIPFETFMGFKGDKIPDIDLNFSAVYQGKAHDFIKNMFGEERVFRAGTISTTAEKTAYGYVKSYFEESKKTNARNAEITRIAKKCENVKRTTGQHPGGIVVVPHGKDVYDFTPFNYPADDKTQDWFTTHLAFESLHDSLLKFDILGHDNPTILKMLTEQTKVNADTIPNFDNDVMDLFNSTDSLKIKNPMINKILKTGSSGIPEFGTNFVKEMLLVTKPQKFSDLIRISGLSHGTNVWNDNAKYLIEEKGLTISDVISCRDDIMVYLINKGITPIIAFKIMEDVRKGKGLNDEYQKILNDNNIPSWYIESCNKISYLFPKAHATAYVIMAWKIAWFKIYYPLHFYASYFSIRIKVFDIKTILNGESEITNKINEIKEKMANPKTKALVKNKELDLIPIYELALELLGRGYKFANIDLKKSLATDFLVEGNYLIPPFSAIDGLGDSVATSIVKAREEKMFSSKEDFKKRTKVTTTHMKIMEELGITSSLNEDDQISLFNF